MTMTQRVHIQKIPKKINLDIFVSETGFMTGNEKKTRVNQNIINGTSKFAPSFRSGPARSYNCHEKGHISSKLEEKNLHIHYFDIIRNAFKKIE